MRRRMVDPRALAVTALMTAVVFALTQLKLMPTPDGGYIHPGDAGILFSAFAFGPWVGAVVGGLGTALADIFGGAGQWSPFSLVIHGVQGWVVGWIADRWPGIWGFVVATTVGAIIVVLGYLPAGMILQSPSQAFASLPFNALQVIIGSAIGVPLFVLVRRAYPPITRMRQKGS